MNLGKTHIVASLADLPPHIKQRYQRLALVTDQAHIERLAPGDEDTLIVSCDWLLWQQAVSEGRHCVHYELGLLGWEDLDGLETDLFIRANDWVYQDGKDMTVFRGASLGKMFNAEMTMCLINFHRLERTLGTLIERFRPEQIQFFDFKNDINILNRPQRVLVAETVAKERNVAFVDRGREINSDIQQISERPHAPAKRNLLVRLLLYLYTRILETGTGLRCLLADREKRALLLVNTNMAEPLVMNFSGGGLTPIFLSRTPPKRLGVWWRCFRNGVLLATPKETTLSDDDREDLARMRSVLEEAAASPAPPVLRILRAFAWKNIIQSGKLTDAARDLRTADETLNRYRPKRLIVDGVRAQATRAYIEAARNKDVAVDYIWHSVLATDYLKFEGLSDDPCSTPLVNRCLTWGEVNDIWLDEIDAKQPRVRVGSPLGDRYKGWNADPAPKPLTKSGNILVLQCNPVVCNMRGLNASMYGIFVDLVQALMVEGYSNIRYKLHPGPGRLKKDYVENIAQFFDIDCPVLKTEPFEECLKWADIVIGPVVSGATFEVLAAGLPYFPLLLPPHNNNISFYQGHPIYSSAQEVIEALRRKEPGFGRGLLDIVYSADTHANGPERFWEVMREDFN